VAQAKPGPGKNRRNGQLEEQLMPGGAGKIKPSPRLPAAAAVKIPQMILLRRNSIETLWK
jgi:hypothetical protein